MNILGMIDAIPPWLRGCLSVVAFTAAMAALAALLQWGGLLDAQNNHSARPASEGYSVFIMKAHQVGCRNRSTIDRLVSTVAIAHDKAGAAAILAQQEAIGECFIWRRGMRVRIEERPFLSGTACFAEYGTTKRCYWSQSSAAEELRR